jgi:hypothetical protein
MNRPQLEFWGINNDLIFNRQVKKILVWFIHSKFIIFLKRKAMISNRQGYRG